MKYTFEKPIHASIGKEKYNITVEWRNGKFIADEPVTKGGQDLGPDPFTLLLSALASCTLATLRMYIDHKRWDIPGITVNVNMFQDVKDESIHTTIDRDIRFDGTVDSEQRAKLLEIASKCPVSRALKGDVSVRSYIYITEPAGKKVNYTNGEITVTWEPELCKHSGRCVFGLPKVFDVNKHPWINMAGATTEEIAEQVSQCPTGALKYFRNVGVTE